MELPITSEVVQWAYRLFLDREPENETVVEEKSRDCKSILELRRVFLRSEEFKSKNPGLPTLSGHEPPIDVEYSVSDRELKKIFKHVQKSWTSLGLNDPYFSVLTQGEFGKSAMSEERIDEFYESGKKEVDRLFKTLARNSIDSSSFRNCLDFGCGAGRISRWLSASFEAVHAYDVSKNYLEMAQDYLENIDILNVDFRQVKSIDDLGQFPKVDLIYSVIVLQHNPPPIMHRIIGGFMKALNPGGVAFFQLPTYKEGYRFFSKKYLRHVSSKDEMEMHVLPQRVVFEIVREGNGKILEVVEDFNTSWGLSNTFLIQKI
jgi:2-polyprenyl-3-methyl-5-hydroxy-6-metoxy-1,4-benzoquinol methylase